MLGRGAEWGKNALGSSLKKLLSIRMSENLSVSVYVDLKRRLFRFYIRIILFL